jgi:L,D-transpeptidase YcbB
MSGVSVDRLLILVAVVLVVSGGSFAWPKSGLNFAAATSDPTTVTPLAHTPSTEPASADQRSSAALTLIAASAKLDEAKPNEPGEKDAEPPANFVQTTEPAATAAHPVAPTEGDEVPSPVAPATTRISAAPGPGAPPEGDEVPSPVFVAPEISEASVPAPAISSGGDEVTTPTVLAPTSTGALSPKPASADRGDAAGPMSTVVDANAPIADQLREISKGKFDRVLHGEKDRTALEAVYALRNYTPLWITDGKGNMRAQAVIAYLARVDADGLDPADYPVPDFTSLTDLAALAEAEVKLSAAVTTYAHHAQVGKVHWTRVSGDVFYELRPPAPADVLTNVAGANDIEAALAAYEPQTPGYIALKAKLAELRAKVTADRAPIPNGPVLKVGMQDERVPQLRERLGVNGDGPTFDKALADAVKKFQQDNNLKPTGVVAAATLEALNGRRSDRTTDTVIANMERWRWMPHDLGKTYVMVNIPDFMLYVIQNGRQVWATKVVDGKPETPTPIMSAEMKSITVNPTWNIPDTIAAREYVPLMRQDSTILERMGLNVSYNRDNTIHISQPPGPNNALGQLRFNFPNKFFVYQHDSNEKYLFAKPVRDSSHGCMRVQDPAKYAEVLLAIARPREGFTEERIRGMFGTEEIEVRLPIFVPVHLTYQTAFVDKEGKLQSREDIYGRDKALLAILKSNERKVADIPIERKDNVVRREALAMPDQAWGWGGQNFFARLFGSPAAPSGPRRRSVTERVQ